MKIRQTTWKLSKLIELRQKINLSPAWQRGATWKPVRQVLLIDSVLRGMDIPKIYLKRVAEGRGFRYEAVDGQQRLRALWEFIDGTLPLTRGEQLLPVNGHPLNGLTFNQLHRDLKRRFAQFVISIAEIIEATNDEITNLFARLQMGVPLNPAELRNAMLVPMRHVIDLMATTHPFFSESRIPDNRYKRQDFLTHVYAMAAYHGERDIKAKDLKALLQEFDHNQSDRILELTSEVGDALNVLRDVNALTDSQITQKWIFVDLMWLIIQRQAQGSVVKADRLAAHYLEFDKKRREFNSRPEELINGKKRVPSLHRHLYNYILAFRTQGGMKANLAIRHAALNAWCPDGNGRF